MGIDDKAKNVAKDIKGKAQEMMGTVTGDKSQQMKGKANQAEAKAQKAVENVKDNLKDALGK